MNYNTKQFDVIILWSGLAGSILATILARHNIRVLMIDKGSHPRFAVGEAMTPDTDLMMSILSYQYDVPEIFTDIEHLQQKLFDDNDTLVNCSYISFADFNLWDAWRRIWILGSFMRQAKAGLKKKLKIAAGKGKELFDINSSNLDSLTLIFELLGDNFFLLQQ